MDRVPCAGLGALLFLYCTGASAATPSSDTSAADAVLNERLTRLERRIGALPDIVSRLDRLQNEIRELRGELEVQVHALKSLQKRQRDLYLDIDNRLNQLSRGGVAVQPTLLPADTDTPPSVPATAPEIGSPAAEQPQPVPVAPSVVDPVQEEQAYQKAFILLREGHYQESITAFRSFLEQYPVGSYADNAQYWLGEANYVSRAFDTALKEFGLVISRYPNSAKIPGAMLKTGYIHYEQQQWKQAREVLTRLIEQYPGATESRLAARRLERMRGEGH